MNQRLSVEEVLLEIYDNDIVEKEFKGISLMRKNRN